MALYEKDGRSGNDIARQRGFEKAVVAGALTVLKKEGLVKGTPDPESGTLKLTLTEKGRNIEPEMKKIGAATTAALLKGFDADDLAQVMTALKKIAVNASRL
jgi:DNA-binding MarR family transcriptional regulator